MSNALTNEDFDKVVTIIGLLAEDVWDETPISVHIRSAGSTESQVERLTLALANVFGFESTDGSYATDEYLDSVGSSQGVTHQRFIEVLRDWVRENHPDAYAHDYAQARGRRFVRR